MEKLKTETNKKFRLNQKERFEHIRKNFGNRTGTRIKILEYIRKETQNKPVPKSWTKFFHSSNFLLQFNLI